MRAEFETRGVSLFAGTSDSEADTLTVAEPLGYPIGYGVTRSEGDQLSAWWAEDRNHIQPTEFILNRSGMILASTYSNSPLGRMDPDEAMVMINFIRG